MKTLEKVIEAAGWELTDGDLDTLADRATISWKEGRQLCEIDARDLLRLVKACEALATVKVDRDLWKAQAEAAQRERDEARAAGHDLYRSLKAFRESGVGQSMNYTPWADGADAVLKQWEEMP